MSKPDLVLVSQTLTLNNSLALPAPQFNDCQVWMEINAERVMSEQDHGHSYSIKDTGARLAAHNIHHFNADGSFDPIISLQVKNKMRRRCEISFVYVHLTIWHCHSWMSLWSTEVSAIRVALPYQFPEPNRIPRKLLDSPQTCKVNQRNVARWSKAPDVIILDVMDKQGIQTPQIQGQKLVICFYVIKIPETVETEYVKQNRRIISKRVRSRAEDGAGRINKQLQSTVPVDTGGGRSRKNSGFVILCRDDKEK